MDIPLLLRQTGFFHAWKGRERFVVFQTDFGNGLPFLQIWHAWQCDPQAPKRLHFFALAQPDAAPLPPSSSSELARLLHAVWPRPLPGLHRLEFEQGRIVLTLGFAPPKNMGLQLQADAFLISPENTPSEFPLRHLSRYAAPGAILAAASLQTHQRAELLEAGFQTSPCDPSGLWTGQLLRPGPVLPPASPNSAIVIGAGLAGTAIASRLALRGWETHLIEKLPHPAQEASGNRAAVLSPMVSKDESRTARLSCACFLHLLREIRQLNETGFPVEWSDCGMLQLAKSREEESALSSIAARYPQDYLQFLSAEAMREKIGHSVPGLFFPSGGWVNPASLCRARLDAAGPNLHRHFNEKALRIEPTTHGWNVFGNETKPLVQSSVLVLANAHEALQFPALHGLRFKKVRGQVTHLPEPLLPPVAHVLCRDGYLTPAHDGFCCLGATYDFDTDSRALNPAGHRANLARLPELLGIDLPAVDPETLLGRVGFRTLTPDRLPVVGALPDFSRPPADELRKIARLPGLYGLLGLGSRGLVWSSLMAELLASEITGDPLPLERDLVDATDPARFQVRAFRSQPSL